MCTHKHWCIDCSKKYSRIWLKQILDSAKVLSSTQSISGMFRVSFYCLLGGFAHSKLYTCLFYASPMFPLFLSVQLRKVIEEVALSSGHCRGCPLRSPALVSWQSTAVLLSLKTQMVAISLFSHSPVLSLELLPPAGHLSLFSTSSSCSGTTPSPMGWSRQKMLNSLLLQTEQTHTTHQKAIRKPYCFTATFSQSLAAFSTAAIKCGCCVPSATWHLPVFPWLNSLDRIYVSQIDD